MRSPSRKDLFVSDFTCSGLSGDNLYAFVELQIPQKRPSVVVKETPEDTAAEKLQREKQLLFRFRQTERATEAEARFYLTTFDYNYDLAIQERRADVEFEEGARAGNSLPRAVKFEAKKSKNRSSSAGFDWF